MTTFKTEAQLSRPIEVLPQRGAEYFKIKPNGFTAKNGDTFMKTGHKL